ncbi:MAG TPA: DUF302 domain-containing protein [Steroidobacteraceae bacterium]
MTIPADQQRGIVRMRSAHSVTATLERLEGLLKARGIIVFARIDFSGDAARAGLAMRAEQLLIFGNPKGGTPLMQAAPTVGLDLPFKALAWEDEHGEIWIACNDARYIVQRHGLAPALSVNLSVIMPIIEQAAQP